MPACEILPLVNDVSIALNSTAGRLAGSVTNSSKALGNARVWVEQDTVVATTFSEASGDYGLLGLPEGAYDLYATKTDRDTVEVKDVTIAAGSKTEKDIQFLNQ